MSLTTVQILKHQSFTPLPLPQDVINGIHNIERRIPKGLDIRDRAWRPFLEPEDGKNYDEDNSTYTPSDDGSSNKKYESDDNHRNHNNLNPPPYQEMAHQPAGATIKNDNAGVHQNENVGVLQNTITHSPQSEHNEPQNDPTIKMENTIDKTGNENGAENEDKNDAENEDKNGHKDPDKDENKQED